MMLLDKSKWQHPYRPNRHDARRQKWARLTCAVLRERLYEPSTKMVRLRLLRRPETETELTDMLLIGDRFELPENQAIMAVAEERVWCVLDTHH